MLTRYAETAELKPLAAILKRSGSDFAWSRAALLRYQKNVAGKIAVTLADDGMVRTILAYRVVDQAAGIHCDKYLHIDTCALDVDHDADQKRAALSLTHFLRAALIAHKADSAVFDVHNCDADYMRQVCEIGFLPEIVCDECGGGLYVFSATPEHTGSVIIERILSGNAEVYAEV